MGTSKWLKRSNSKSEIMKRRMEFDLWYLNNWTILARFLHYF